MKKTNELKDDRIKNVVIAFEAMKRKRLVHKEQSLENAINEKLIFSKAKTKGEIEKCLSKAGIQINFSDMSAFGNGILVTIR